MCRLNGGDMSYIYIYIYTYMSTCVKSLICTGTVRACDLCDTIILAGVICSCGIISTNAKTYTLYCLPVLCQMLYSMDSQGSVMALVASSRI